MPPDEPLFTNVSDPTNTQPVVLIQSEEKTQDINAEAEIRLIIVSVEKEWQDNQDRITERIEIQNTIVENLESKYEKLNQKLSDEKDILDAIIELEEHRQEISFREFFPARYYESILTELQESYEIQNNSFKNAISTLSSSL